MGNYETVTINSTADELKILDGYNEEEARSRLEAKLKYLEEVSTDLRKFELKGEKDNPHALPTAKTAFEVAILMSKLPQTDPIRKDDRYLEFLNDTTAQFEIRRLYDMEAHDSWVDIILNTNTKGDDYKNIAIILYGYSRLISDILDLETEIPEIQGYIRAPKELLKNGIQPRKTSLISRSWATGNEYLEKAQTVLAVATRP